MTLPQPDLARQLMLRSLKAASQGDGGFSDINTVANYYDIGSECVWQISQ